MTVSGTNDDDDKTVFEIFRDGLPKYKVISSSKAEQYFIDGELVTQVEWMLALEKDKP
jgi:hypothetical protein